MLSGQNQILERTKSISLSTLMNSLFSPLAYLQVLRLAVAAGSFVVEAGGSALKSTGGIAATAGLSSLVHVSGLSAHLLKLILLQGVCV